MQEFLEGYFHAEKEPYAKEIFLLSMGTANRKKSQSW
jgi:hypothetical protein